MLWCMIDRADARLLYKRVPDVARKGNRDLEAAFALLQQLWVSI